MNSQKLIDLVHLAGLDIGRVVISHPLEKSYSGIAAGCDTVIQLITRVSIGLANLFDETGDEVKTLKQFIELVEQAQVYPHSRKGYWELLLIWPDLEWPGMAPEPDFDFSIHSLSGEK